MAADLVIRNGSYVLPGGTVVKDLGLVIQDGQIKTICKPEYLPTGGRVIDATGKHILPGLIDPHVHTREPGYEYKEETISCSAAAAAGGITTMLLMFNVKPPINSVETFHSFVEYTAARTMVNFNVNAVLIESNFDQIPKLAEAGAASLKILIGYKFDVSGGAGRPDVVGVSCPDDGGLIESMHMVAETGIVLTVHAENDSIIRRKQSALQAKGERGPLAHMESRPRVAADEAIGRMIRFSRETNCRVHILHLETGNGIQMVRQAQLEGLKVTCETCPHYLLLTNEDDMPRLGAIAKINPPIRTKWDQDRLWEGIHNGSVTVIGTDHSPHAPQEKMVDRPFDDLFKAMAGFVGVETSIPLMLTEVNKGRLPLTRLVELCSSSPAKLFGLYPTRGALQVGSAGDVTIVDLEQESVIDASKLHSKTCVTPFDGWKVKGLPTHTIVGGKVVYEQGQVLGKAGDGKFVRAHHAAA